MNKLIAGALVLSFVAVGCTKKDEPGAEPDKAKVVVTSGGEKANVTVQGGQGAVNVQGAPGAASVQAGGTTVQANTGGGASAAVVNSAGSTVAGQTGPGGSKAVVNNPGGNVVSGEVNKDGTQKAQAGGVKVEQGKDGKSTVVVPGLGTIKTQ